MDITCSARNLLVIAVLLLFVLICLYVIHTSIIAFFAFFVPLVIGVAFLILWLFTTATGLVSYGRLFLCIYLVSVFTIEVGAWWMCYSLNDSFHFVQADKRVK